MARALPLSMKRKIHDWAPVGPTWRYNPAPSGYNLRLIAFATTNGVSLSMLLASASIGK